MDIRKALLENQARFKGLCDKIEEAHRAALLNKTGNSGHGVDHDLMVAQYCLLIAESKHEGDLAWIAARLHSLDRLIQNADMSAKSLPSLIGEYLTLLPEDISSYDRSLILCAVLDHSKKNDDSDSVITMILKDADRLANSGPTVIIRSGQCYPNIPAVELGYLDKSHPLSTYRAPRSSLDNFRDCLVWESWLRMPKAKVLGKRNFDFLRAFILEAQQQYVLTGLDPWPVEE